MSEWIGGMDQPPMHQPEETVPETGFWQNAQQAFAIARAEDLPLISRLHMSETREARIKGILDHNKAGRIPDDVMDFYWSQPGGLDVDALAQYARDTLGLTDIPTAAEYDEANKAEYADNRAVAAKVSQNQNALGWIGEFAGKMAAIPTDPLYAVSFFTGYGGAVTALQAAGRVAVAEMAVEAAAQPFVYGWKQEIGADYSAVDGIVNIVAAGVLGGTMAGVGKAISNKVTNRRAAKWLKDNKVMDDPAVAPIAHVIKESDPKEAIEVTLKRDEGIDKAHNERGAHVNDASPDADEAFTKQADALEDELDAQFEAQRKADEADEAAEAAEAREPVVNSALDDIIGSPSAPSTPAPINPVPVAENIRKNGGEVNFDNPGGDWEMHARKEAASKDREFGLRHGPVTAKVDNVSLSVDEVLELPGMNKEHLQIKPDNPKVAKLAEDMRTNGFDPDQPIFINVGYDGKALINEGNHRIRAAKAAGLDSVPVEIAYRAGGEKVDGPISLQRVSEYAPDEGVTQVTPPPVEHKLPIVKQHLDYVKQVDEFLDACGRAT